MALEDGGEEKRCRPDGHDGYQAPRRDRERSAGEYSLIEGQDGEFNDAKGDLFDDLKRPFCLSLISR